ncbi:hypothetical protein [Oryzomonas japonica]|uniref:hypothetical protein n=1 Tax=Oryzomonas japonica TaxID=2603858 RepID=UPI0017837CD1|nr:hypothetical protein [Oryzomonas japonica]
MSMGSGYRRFDVCDTRLHGVTGEKKRHRAAAGRWGGGAGHRAFPAGNRHGWQFVMIDTVSGWDSEGWL